MKDKDPREAIPAIVRASCGGNSKEADAARAEWSKRLGMSEEDWADAVASLGDSNQYSDHHETIGWEDADHAVQKIAFSAYTPMQQFYAINHSQLGFTSGNNEFIDAAYIADALGPKLSELGKLGFALRCMKQLYNWPLEVAMCNGDVEHIDRAKINLEARAENTTPLIKMKLRFLMTAYDKLLPQYMERVKKNKAEDPAYAKMFDIAAATRAEWDTVWKNETKLLDLALAMDDARETKSKKAHEGCVDTTWAAWREFVSKIPAKSLAVDNPSAVLLSTPRGYLAAVAFASCAKEDQDGVTGALNSALSHGPGRRGPRTATWQAIAEAGLSLDNAGDKINYGYPNLTNRFNYSNNGTDLGVAEGTIAKISKPDAKGMVTITFAKKMEKKEACLQSKDTNRISHFMPDGSPVYYHTCLKWGMETIDKTPDPVTVFKRYIDGIKPGMNGDFDRGGVVGVFPKGKRTPVNVLGVPVK